MWVSLLVSKAYFNNAFKAGGILEITSYCFHFIEEDTKIFVILIPLPTPHYSDAFDIQYGVVVIRLKEGLDISHLQGQGKSCLNKFFTLKI